MKTLTLIKDCNQIREYKLNDGRTITIDISDDRSIVVKDHQNNSIGEIILSLKEDVPSRLAHYYYITSMFMNLRDDSYLCNGIGRAALIFFKDFYSLPIKASKNDGLRKDDGSHLTGNAPGFVEKMRNEGIIEPIFE